MSATSSAPFPRHLAIIMDGNGRWATQRGRPRLFGHEAGAKAVRRLVRAVAERGIEHLTLYAFSHENWNRPEPEVKGLMGLLQRTLSKEGDTLVQEGVRVDSLGELDRLPKSLAAEVRSLEEASKGNTGLHLHIALSYSGRREIAAAAQRLCERVSRGELQPKDVDEAALEGSLLTAGLPDPDLIVRTGGESRLSNFLLWQAAYAELMMLETLWPDFDEEALDEVLEEYRGRSRRFGRTPKQAAGAQE